MSDWPQGYGRRVLAEVDSTNAQAARIAGELAEPAWILGLRQTAARGRRGRAWLGLEGNFAATLVMHPKERPGHAALRSFVAALALFDAVVAATGRDDNVALKWPNDVLLDGGKLAGILLESKSGAGGLAHLAIGIGVNLAATPDEALLEEDALRPVSLLSQAGVTITPEAFLDLLAPAYACHEACFVRDGFAPIRAAWLARAAKLGEPVTARTMREQITGRFETVDETGNLVLSAAGRRRAIPAAEVFF